MIHYFDTLDSTMHKAAEFALAGAEHGTIVVADTQTAGQGRLGRTWHSERGSGLYATFILRPQLSPETLPVITLALGLATAEAIARTAGIACDLRWPNDVLIGEHKCAGILAQLNDSALLAGIGVNVNHAAFAEDLAPIATSLRIATGREQSRDALLTALIDTVETQVNLLQREGKDPILRAFAQASSYVSGRRVIVDDVRRGTTDGLDGNGFLILRQDNGLRAPILAGGVRPECS